MNRLFVFDDVSTGSGKNFRRGGSESDMMSDYDENLIRAALGPKTTLTRGNDHIGKNLNKKYQCMFLVSYSREYTL